jgi:CBS domain-containing protein
VVDVAEIGEENLLVHDETAAEPTLAYLLSRMGPPDFPTPVGVFRCIKKPVYDQALMAKIEASRRGDPPGLEELFRQTESWTVPARDAHGVECPSCGTPNLPGADECEMCLISLTHEERSLSEIQQLLEASLYDDTVADLKPAAAVTVSENTKVRKTFDIMKKHGIGSVIVVDDDGQLAGLFTEGDILALLDDEADVGDRHVGDMMTRNPETTAMDSSLAEVIHRLSVSGLRYLPILDEEGRPVSILSARDLVDFLSARIEN